MYNVVCTYLLNCHFGRKPKLYIPSTLNIDLILWHTQLIVCAQDIKSWFKSWVIHFTFQAYTQPHTLNCICVSLFKFHTWILEQFFRCPKRLALPRHTKVFFFSLMYFYFHEHTTFLITIWNIYIKISPQHSSRIYFLVEHMQAR